MGAQESRCTYGLGASRWGIISSHDRVKPVIWLSFVPSLFFVARNAAILRNRPRVSPHLYSDPKNPTSLFAFRYLTPTVILRTCKPETGALAMCRRTVGPGESCWGSRSRYLGPFLRTSHANTNAPTPRRALWCRKSWTFRSSTLADAGCQHYPVCCCGSLSEPGVRQHQAAHTSRPPLFCLSQTPAEAK